MDLSPEDLFQIMLTYMELPLRMNVDTCMQVAAYAGAPRRIGSKDYYPQLTLHARV